MRRATVQEMDAATARSYATPSPSLTRYPVGYIARRTPLLSTPRQEARGFFPPLMPARSWARLPARLSCRETYGVATFPAVT